MCANPILNRAPNPRLPLIYTMKALAVDDSGLVKLVQLETGKVIAKARRQDRSNAVVDMAVAGSQVFRCHMPAT